MEKDLVSVVLPVYNREATISRAIESVLGQSYSNLELIIVNDASNDNTVKQIEKYTDSRIKVLHHEKRGGAAKARNFGVSAAKGRYVAFQDSDDEWLVTKLEQQIAFMENENYKVSFSPYRLYAEKEYIVPFGYSSLSPIQTKEILREKNIIGTPTLIVRRNVLEELGAFNELLPALEDYELAIRIAKKYEIGYLNKLLVNAYRVTQCLTSDCASIIQANRLIWKLHRDFLSDVTIKTYLYRILPVWDIIGKDTIDWEVLERNLNDCCETTAEREDVYRMLIENVHNRYKKIKTGMDAAYNQFNEYLVNGQFVIYGAGVIGKRTYEGLKAKGLFPRYFVVTVLGNEKEIDSVPIIEFKEFKENLLPIVVAVSGKYHIDVLRNIQEQKNFQYVISPECF